MREKIKWDSMKSEIGEDREGFCNFHYTFYLQGKMVDKLIISDCSHRKAEEKMFKHRCDKMECVYNDTPSHEEKKVERFINKTKVI